MNREPVNSEIFRHVCARWATGVAVATVTGMDGTPQGLTVSSFTPVSLTPPLVLVCVDHSAACIAHFRAARHFGISILDESQRRVSMQFATSGADRFAECKWRAGATGVPLIAGALAQLECCLRQTVVAGDHDIFIGEVVFADAGDDDPLLYFRSRYSKLKHG
jgi:flavin reductase (DIM6/NTAB) family NADH-FMN oxidoreductase RutF